MSIRIESPRLPSSEGRPNSEQHIPHLACHLRNWHPPRRYPAGGLHTMAAVAPSRLAALNRLRCEIFQTAYNPTSIRTGAKYLRAHLRGPAMIRYYPDELTVKKFNAMPGQLKIEDWDEYQRLSDVEEKKRRGKGVPKKAKSPGPSYIASYGLITHP
ncbi:mitochondrial ribosomal subunit S27-domain-containing protein, partial [Trametes elegans]